MLYLLSGASRSGKTTVAKRILKQKGIPYLSLDWIVMGFTNGMPECGIHDKLFPDEIAERLSGFLEDMCKSMLWTGEDYLIEGEAILPESVRTLLDCNPDNITACFMGFTHVDVAQKVRDVKTYSAGERDWLTKEPDEYICDHIANMIEYSKKIKHQCEQQNVRYFDTSVDFAITLDRVTQFMLERD